MVTEIQANLIAQRTEYEMERIGEREDLKEKHRAELKEFDAQTRKTIGEIRSEYAKEGKLNASKKPPSK